MVNGAPEAAKDLEIAEEALTACGLSKDAEGVWRLPAAEEPAAEEPAVEE